MHPTPRRFLPASVSAGVMLFILLGVSPRSDVAAHLGGFIGGLVIAWPLTRIPESKLQSPRANWICGLILTSMVILTWWLALKPNA